MCMELSCHLVDPCEGIETLILCILHKGTAQLCVIQIAIDYYFSLLTCRPENLLIKEESYFI